MNIEITQKQKKFIDADADEVLFGGRAGGGKSYAQIIDALIYALKYPGSKQLILRRTFPELDRSLIRTALALYPQSIYRYTATNHIGKFSNGSVLEFGYCDSENDVYKYQSAEYDVIRFDELTHFTKQMYVYLISRLRGVNGYPKQVKSSTNPGGVGHSWVKERFIDIGRADEKHTLSAGSRIFIPSLVTDNLFLMKSDADYVKRLENLSEKDKRALLCGDWDIADGRYYDEWNRQIHTVKPFEIPPHWKKYRSMDYGLDMLAVLFIAYDGADKYYVYDEIYKPNLIISRAAAEINRKCKETPSVFYAPPDMWNRRQDSGASVARIFRQNGIYLTKSQNDRVSGRYRVKEFLKIRPGQDGKDCRALQIFTSCTNLIRTLPSLSHDSQNPNDVSDKPHELTHAPDALRYFCVMNTLGGKTEGEDGEDSWYDSLTGRQ